MRWQTGHGKHMNGRDLSEMSELETQGHPPITSTYAWYVSATWQPFRLNFISFQKDKCCYAIKKAWVISQRFLLFLCYALVLHPSG